MAFFVYDIYTDRISSIYTLRHNGIKCRYDSGFNYFIQIKSYIYKVRFTVIKYVVLLFYSMQGLAVSAQYTLNGSATINNCHCYTLTPNILTQSGSVWNNNRIDLNQPFTFTFEIFLGCTDANGADGIAFVLQPISTSVGTTGSGMGYGGITPAIGVTLDTYQNTIPDNDPFYDHIAIQLNGDLNHSSANTITPLTPISATTNDIEDCAWHRLKISWNPITTTLMVWFDDQLRVSATQNFISTVLGGNSLVYWGFTGATGGLSNLQQFCTTLNPHFYLLPAQKRCVNEPITFYDSTISFAPVQLRHWDFGDGSPIDMTSLNPVHTYTVPGDYTVRLVVSGIDGCTEVKTQLIRIGSKPVADFTWNNACVNNPVNFTNTSSAQVGTINYWYWDFGDATTGSVQHPTKTYSIPGNKNVRLAVKSIEGCVSDTTAHTIQVYPAPVADFSFVDNQCQGVPVQFSNQSTVSPGSITSWNWNFGNGTSTNSSPVQVFPTPGTYTITLVVISNNTCTSAVKSKTLTILPKPTAYFKTSSTCQLIPTVFTDSSYSGVNQWWWDLGNGTNASTQNPTNTYTVPGPDTVKLVVTSNNGCRSDTLSKPIFVNAKPIADFGYDALICYGTPVQFSDSSTVATGAVNAWSWTYSGNQWSTVSNPSRAFFPGSQTVGLVATSIAGCKSDTTYRSFFIYPEVTFDMVFSNACKNTPVDFSATDNTGGNIREWEWTFEPGITANTRNAVHTFGVNGTFAVRLKATDGIGCSAEETRNIMIYGTNAFAGNDTIAAAGQPVTLNADGGLSYQWSPVTGLDSPFNENPVATIFNTRTYTVKAFTPEGCESYDDVTIKIYDGPEIYLPNAFTPNGDGLNDVFRGIAVGVKEFRYMKIFNRWGQEIFSSTNYRNGWDGKWKGQHQAAGVFIVIVHGTDFNGKEIFKKGTVMLVR